MASNENFHQAKLAKNDELYTQLTDVDTAILRNNIFTHMNINFVCALGGVA